MLRKLIRHLFGVVGDVDHNNATTDHPAAIAIGVGGDGALVHIHPNILSRADVIAAATELLHRSGWRRLEIYRPHGSTTPTGGWCIDADGISFSITDPRTDVN